MPYYISLIDLPPSRLACFLVHIDSCNKSTFTMAAHSTITYTKVSPLAEEVIPTFAVDEKYTHGYIIDCTNIYFKCDTIIRVFNKATGDLRLILEGHETNITTLSLTGNLLLSIDENVIAKRWNTKTGECVSTYTFNWEPTDYLNRPVHRKDNYIKVAYATDDKIIGACTDDTIRLWTIEDVPKCTVFTYLYNVVALHVRNNRVFASSRNGNVSIHVWDFATKKCSAELFHHASARNSHFTCITSTDDTIYAGDYHGNVVSWCATTLEPFHLINRDIKFKNVHAMSIWALHCQDNILTSGTYVGIPDVVPFVSWRITDSRKQAFVALLCMHCLGYPPEIVYAIMSHFRLTPFDYVNTYAPDGKFVKSR